MGHESTAIVTEVLNSVAVVRFNRPLERNPLSRSTLFELKAVLTSVIPRQDINCIIFTGAADVFLSGANIRELEQLDPDNALDFSKLGQGIFQQLANAPQTTIAAINGYCMGGGLDLALACDIRIASPNAVFAHPGARLGIITGWGGTQRLPGIVGKTAALDMLLTAGRISSDQALKLGLVTRMVGHPLEYALALVKPTTSQSE